MNSTDNFTCPRTTFVWYMFPYNISMFVLYTLVILTALTANILVCIAVAITPKLRQDVASYFIISLAISDIATASFSMPFDLESFTTFGLWYHDEMLCIVWTTAYLITIPTSMWNLFVLSIDRYRILSNPWDRFKKTPFMTKRRALLVLGTLWICSIVYALVPLMGWKYTDSSLNTMNECSGTKCIFNISPLYSILSSVFNFYLPMLGMCFIYYKIYQIARTQYLKPSPSPQLEVKSAANSPVGKPNGKQKNATQKCENEENKVDSTEMPKAKGRRWEIELIKDEGVALYRDRNLSDIACQGTLNDERQDNKVGSIERTCQENECQESTTKRDIYDFNGYIDKETEEIKTKTNTASLDDREGNNERSQNDNAISVIVETGNYEEKNINIGYGVIVDEGRRLSQANGIHSESPEEERHDIVVTERPREIPSPTTNITNKTDVSNATAMTDDEIDAHMDCSVNGDPVPTKNDAGQGNEERNSNESIESHDDDETASSPHLTPDQANATLEMQHFLRKNIISEDKSASQESLESTCTLQSTLTYIVNRVNMFGSRETINNIAYVDNIMKRKKIFVKNKKAARTVSIIVGAFLLCWLPRTTMSIVQNICQHRCFSTIQIKYIMLYAGHLTLLLGYLSTVINPIVYSYRNVHFRRSYQRMIRKVLPCLKTHDRNA